MCATVRAPEERIFGWEQKLLNVMECCLWLGGRDDDTNKRAEQYAQVYAEGGVPGQAIMGGHRASGDPVGQSFFWAIPKKKGGWFT